MLFFLHRGQRPGHSRSNPNPNYEQGPSLSQNSFCPSLQYTLRIKQLAARGKVEGKIRGTVPTSAGCGDMIICYTNHSAWKNLSSNWCSHHPNPSDHSPSHSPYQKMHVSCRTCHSRKHLPKHKGLNTSLPSLGFLWPAVSCTASLPLEGSFGTHRSHLTSNAPCLTWH